jgi:hypothetical protein
LEEDEREGHENQPEPEIQPGPEDEGQEEQPELETQPVSPGEAEQEQSEPGIEPQPAPTSAPGQSSSTGNERRRQFFLGLGIGFIPLVLFFLGFAPNIGWLIALSLILWLVTLIASIVCIFIPRVRYVGYGLLTSVPITLVVGSIGCIIIITRPRG